MRDEATNLMLICVTVEENSVEILRVLRLGRGMSCEYTFRRIASQCEMGLECMSEQFPPFRCVVRSNVYAAEGQQQRQQQHDTITMSH